MLAVYILSRSLKTKRSRSHQIRSNDVGGWLLFFFFPVKKRLLRYNQDRCLVTLWPETYIFLSHQGSSNAQDYSSLSHEEQGIPGKLL